MGVVLPFPQTLRPPRQLISMGESLAMMPWFPGDFLASTRGWSVTATGVYRALLDAQWDLGLLPKSPQNLRKTIGATLREWNQGWALCECKFPLVEGGRLNGKLEQHRRKALELKGKRRQGALSTNAKRWVDEVAERSDSESLSESTPSQLAITERIAGRSHPSPSPSPSPSLEELKPPPEAAFVGDLETDSKDPDYYLVWVSGLELIGKSRRSLIAKLERDHGRSTLARKIGEILSMPEKPQDPLAYLCGVMKKLERRFQA